MFKNLIPWRKKHESHRVPVRGELTTPMSNEIARLRDEFDSMLDRFWNGNLWEDFDRWNIGWGCEMEDSDKEVVVRAEAPGFKPYEIDIQLSGDRLILQAEHLEESKKNGGTHHTKFYRSIVMPRGIEANNIRADYKNGVLEVH